MGLIHARMPWIVAYVNVVDGPAGRVQGLKGLLSVHRLKRNHVDGTGEIPVAVIRQEGPRWKRLRLNVKHSEPWHKVRQLNEVTHFLIVATGRFCLNVLGRGGLSRSSNYKKTGEQETENRRSSRHVGMCRL